jgi:hypothetical protein
MNRVVFITFSLLLFFTTVKAQTAVDTLTTVLPKVKQKFINTIYMRASPLCIYTGADYLKDKISQNIELGKSFGIMDVGVALGRNALRRDTAHNGTTYMEAKVSMTIAQYGIFSNEMVVGAGYVFNAENFLMLELSYTIYGQFWKRLGMGITTGFYDFSGNTTDNSRNTFGLFFRYGLSRPDANTLLNIPRGRRLMQAHHR